METKINFSDGTSLILNESNLIQPIISIDNNAFSAALGKSFELYWHIQDGLIPSILDVLVSCDYFRVVGNDTVYGSKSIVSIINL